MLQGDGGVAEEKSQRWLTRSQRCSGVQKALASVISLSQRAKRTQS